MRLPDIERTLCDLVRDSPLNVVAELGDLRIYEAPRVGVASAADPLFARLEEPGVVGSHHLSPDDWLPGARAVISWFLPFTDRVRAANRTPGLPALEWLYGRIEGQACNDALCRRLVEVLTGAGYRAVAPSLDPRLVAVQRRSNWSERHVAFIAGLGTLSLNGSIITCAGSAGRLGSVVVDLDLPSTPRHYQDVDEYCNHCGECIDRCPARAIDEDGKDHAICSSYLDTTRERFRPRYGCGKCQTAVPCEDRIP